MHNVNIMSIWCWVPAVWVWSISLCMQHLSWSIPEIPTCNYIQWNQTIIYFIANNRLVLITSFAESRGCIWQKIQVSQPNNARYTLPFVSWLLTYFYFNENKQKYGLPPWVKIGLFETISRFGDELMPQWTRLSWDLIMAHYLSTRSYIL